MRPSNYPLTIYCGTTLDADALSFVYKQGGVIVNLTDYTASAQARTANGDLIFDWSTANGHMAIDGPAGSTNFVVTAAETSALATHIKSGKPSSLTSGLATYEVGAWALELTSPTGRVIRLVEGVLTLSPEIVRG